MTAQPSSWQHIAEQASREMDSKKLSELVPELCRALDDEADRVAARVLAN